MECRTEGSMLLIATARQSISHLFLRTSNLNCQIKRIRCTGPNGLSYVHSLPFIGYEGVDEYWHSCCILDVNTLPWHNISVDLVKWPFELGHTRVSTLNSFAGVIKYQRHISNIRLVSSPVVSYTFTMESSFPFPVALIARLAMLWHDLR